MMRSERNQSPNATQHVASLTRETQISAVDSTGREADLWGSEEGGGRARGGVRGRGAMWDASAPR